MKKIFAFIMISGITINLSAQTGKIELYDLVKKLVTDSTGYENVGDWDIAAPKKLPVKWKTETLEMSDDTSINFFMKGTVDITVNGRSFKQAGHPVKWNIMIKGPRMGYTSFSLITPPGNEIPQRYTIDSIFGKKPFKAKLLKSCDGNKLTGYYYYEVKLPKKDKAFIKLSWISVNDLSAIRVDCFDNWSKYAVKLDCPK